MANNDKTNRFYPAIRTVVVDLISYIGIQIITLVPFRGLELLDNCFRAKIFARKNFFATSCWLLLATNQFIYLEYYSLSDRF